MWTEDNEDVQTIEINDEIELLPEQNKSYIKEELCKDMLSQITENVNYLHLQSIKNKLNDNLPEVDLEYKVTTNKPANKNDNNYAFENVEIKKQIKLENEDEIQNSIIKIQNNNIKLLNDERNQRNLSTSSSTTSTTSSFDNLSSLNFQSSNSINLHPLKNQQNSQSNYLLSSSSDLSSPNYYYPTNEVNEREILKSYIETFALNNHVKPVVDIDSSIKIDTSKAYPITAKPRGYCLIINNVDFKVYERRRGSDLEADYLQEIFRQLDFEILYYRNQTSMQMLECFKNIVKRPELESHDTFVSIVLTHGDDSRVLIGTDATRLKIDSFLNYFTNANCPQLVNKPKLFFIQACRGNNHDFGIYNKTTVSDACPVKTSNCRVRKEIKDPNMLHDVLVVNSTLDGFVSLRNEISGSWFGDALGWALCEHSKDYELQTLLSFVNRKIVEREKGDVQQAIECNYIRFRKKFYFQPLFNKQKCRERQPKK